MKNILFLFVIAMVVKGYGQDRLDEIERSFLERGITISDSIGGAAVKNEFELYTKITERSFIMYGAKIYVANVVYGDKKDYYNYRFLDSISFNHVQFQAGVDFSLSNFHKTANLHQSKFDDKAYFRWTLFYEDAIFSRAAFEKDVDFVNADFMKKANFFQAKFHSTTDFHGVKFNEEANFINAGFKASSDFSFSEINKKATFRNAEFSGIFSINNSTINGEVDFFGARFDSIADFSNSDINGTLNFNNAVLPGFLDLSGITTIANSIDLTEVKVNERYRICRINLVNSDISKIKLRYDNFLLWFPSHTGYDAKCNIYDALLTTLKTNGYQTSYQKLDIEYQKFKYEANGQEFQSYVQEAWWNYGYNKERIFVWVFRIIVLLTLINTLFLKTLMEKVYEMSFLNYEKIRERAQLHHPILNFFLNIPTGLIYTIILLIGGVFGMGFSSSEIKIPNFIGMVYIISAGLLGLSCSAFILNFIFKL